MQRQAKKLVLDLAWLVLARLVPHAPFGAQLVLARLVPALVLASFDLAWLVLARLEAC